MAATYHLVMKSTTLLGIVYNFMKSMLLKSYWKQPWCTQKLSSDLFSRKTYFPPQRVRYSLGTFLTFIPWEWSIQHNHWKHISVSCYHLIRKITVQIIINNRKTLLDGLYVFFFAQILKSKKIFYCCILKAIFRNISIGRYNSSKLKLKSWLKKPAFRKIAVSKRQKGLEYWCAV